MGLSIAQFQHCLPALIDRGFPRADQTTGNYDLDAITIWRHSRHRRFFPAAPPLTPSAEMVDARVKFPIG
jgi:hypothetical protein